ncbi:MAG: hypothetical protein H7263_02735, partial [Candidatus Sericytochromatia bacterium]|nr:hypothetical protein [Candidatus Sericytochromatia bacterium]
EQSLNVGSTNIDFSEGQVAASTEFTHLALNGSRNAFFAVAEFAINPAPTAPATTPAQGSPTTPTAPTKTYYTRNGEFHLDKNGYIRNQDGLFLMGLNQPVSNTVPSALSISLTSGNPEAAMALLINNQNLNVTVNAANGGSLQHSYINDLDNLKFSKYGSQTFDYIGTVTIVNEQAVNGAATSGANVRIAGNSLEASNVQLPSTLVELSLAQKIYSALTKVIQVDQQKLDNILALIR